MSKLNYGSRPLELGERRPTKQEAINKGQVRYWGLHPITEAQMNVGKRKKVITQPLTYSKYAREKLDKESENIERQLIIMELQYDMSNRKDYKTFVNDMIKETKLLLKEFYRLMREQIKAWEAADIVKPKKKKV